jgi:hypothetical protein
VPRKARRERELKKDGTELERNRKSEEIIATPTQPSRENHHMKSPRHNLNKNMKTQIGNRPNATHHHDTRSK